jgi:alpha-L-fucosidase
VTAALVAERGGDATSVDIAIRYDVQDAAGVDSVDFIDRLGYDYEVRRSGGPATVAPLSDARWVDIAGSRTKVARLDTPEQFIPPLPPPRAWETCLTMNDSWGWNPSDANHKSARELVHTLCEVAGRGGNLLLNVSPMGDGALPAVQTERLAAIAEWMAAHGESIHDTTPGLEAWQFYGPTTRRGTRLYLHLLQRPYDTVTVRGVRIRQVTAVRALRRGTALPFRTRCSIADQILNSDPTGELVITVPEAEIDPLATVIAVDFAA